MARTDRLVRSALLMLSSLLAAAPALAAEYYVAPDGKDANNGTLAQPFESVQRAQKAAAPGDTVFIRGGTYAVREDQIARTQGIYAYVFDLDKSGTEKSPIRYFAYKDERPVFDFSKVKPANLRVIAFYVAGSWLHLRGFEVVGVQVTITGHTQSECFQNQGSNNVYERLSMHDGMAIGLYLLNGSNNLILNCDAYRNHDPVSEGGRGGNTDGFGGHAKKGATGNVFRGCRAWFNSDDGYDCINSAEAIRFENCWAMYNGFSPEFKSLGDGNGFKSGGYGSTKPDRLPNPIPRHVTAFCVAVRNKANGFYANHHIGGQDWFNNSAFRNPNNFNMLSRGPDNGADIPGRGHVMRNNLGFDGKNELANLAEGPKETTGNDLAGNYFDLNLKVTEADFVSLDEAELIRPRQPDGDLPKVNFMRLADGSKLIDRGVDIGVKYNGAKPDLGAFEK
jgi:hypothetical protein